MLEYPIGQISTYVYRAVGVAAQDNVYINLGNPEAATAGFSNMTGKWRPHNFWPLL
jgi:hypothetical protein